jgi:hypothetical protein
LLSWQRPFLSDLLLGGKAKLCSVVQYCRDAQITRGCLDAAIPADPRAYTPCRPSRISLGDGVRLPANGLESSWHPLRGAGERVERAPALDPACDLTFNNEPRGPQRTTSIQEQTRQADNRSQTPRRRGATAQTLACRVRSPFLLRRWLPKLKLL